MDSKESPWVARSDAALSPAAPAASICESNVSKTGPIPAGVVIGSDVFYPTVVAGDPIGIPPDSPDNRIDPNSKTSPYAGVGSVQVTSRIGSSVGTGSVIGRRYVLTAAHVLDGNNDGVVNRADRNTGTYFILNFGGNRTHRIAVTKVTVHPDYDGFGNSLDDDIAILELARNVPAGVPIYDLPDGEITQGMVVTIVGYGRSGDGINGYNTSRELYGQARRVEHVRTRSTDRTTPAARRRTKSFGSISTARMAKAQWAARRSGTTSRQRSAPATPAARRSRAPRAACRCTAWRRSSKARTHHYSARWVAA